MLEWISGESEFLYRFPTNEVFLYDPFQNFWVRRVIPDPLRINHNDWTMLADLQTIGLCAVDAFLGLNQAELTQAPL